MNRISWMVASSLSAAVLLSGCKSNPPQRPRILGSHRPNGQMVAPPINSTTPIAVPSGSVAQPVPVQPGIAVPVQPGVAMPAQSAIAVPTQPGVAVPAQPQYQVPAVPQGNTQPATAPNAKPADNSKIEPRFEPLDGLEDAPKLNLN